MGNPKLNLIFDSRRHEKYEPLILELKRQKIKSYEIWPCVIYPDVVRSINSSHKMIVRRAKEEGLKEVFIGEDDLQFCGDGAWEWFLKNKPDEYDIYAAGNYMAFKRPEHHGAMKVDCIVGFHLYCVHERYYDTFLSTKDTDHIDSAQKSDHLYVCYPFAAIQRAGWSANNKAICNYNVILNKDDMYG